MKRYLKSGGGGYCATMPDFKGTALFWGDGESEIEALQDLKIAFKSALIRLLKIGKKIPEPTTKTGKYFFKTNNLLILLF